MSFLRLPKNHGYTLLELILAVAIVGSISAAAVPNYTRFVARAREKVCTYNLQGILYEYQLYCILEEEISLSDYTDLYYAEDEQLCPSGGAYQASGSGEDARLICSVHQEEISIRTEYPFPDPLAAR